MNAWGSDRRGVRSSVQARRALDMLGREDGETSLFVTVGRGSCQGLGLRR